MDGRRSLGFGGLPDFRPGKRLRGAAAAAAAARFGCGGGGGGLDEVFGWFWLRTGFWF